MKKIVRCAELLRNVLAQFDLEGLHLPLLTINKHCSDFADHLTVGCNHGPAAEIVVGEPHKS